MCGSSDEQRDYESNKCFEALSYFFACFVNCVTLLLKRPVGAKGTPLEVLKNLSCSAVLPLSDARKNENLGKNKVSEPLSFSPYLFSIFSKIGLQLPTP